MVVVRWHLIEGYIAIWDGLDLRLGEKYVQLINNFDAELYWIFGATED